MDEKQAPEETTTQRSKEKWAIENIAKRSLNPQVSATEHKEYTRFVYFYLVFTYKNSLCVINSLIPLITYVLYIYIYICN